MARAVIRTRGQPAVVPRPPVVAHAAQPDALAVGRAIVGTSRRRAVGADPTGLAVARAIVAVAMVGAPLGAQLARAVISVHQALDRP